MRAVRVSTLRRNFFALHARYPDGSSIAKADAEGHPKWKSIVKACRSRWRKTFTRESVVTIKGEDYTIAPTQTNTVSEVFVRKIYRQIVNAPSEWRRLKKSYLRNKAAGKR